MADAAVAWDQRPEYLAYTDWTPIPGITSYAVPRKGTGTDVTQFHPGQAFLSEHNLPDIMYQLHPCAEWQRFKVTSLPEPKKNPDGSPVYEQYTRPGDERQVLLDFKILPDKISTEEGWWYHEFVRRMDPRIRLRDIIMREEATAERVRMSDQRYINWHLNTPGYRLYRPAWKMISWHVKDGEDGQNQRRQLILDSLTDAQKRANTTRGSTPGLINPALGEIPGNRVGLPALGAVKGDPRPKRASVSVYNESATQPAQQSQNSQAQQVVQVTQTHQAPRYSQTPPHVQNQQVEQSARASNSHVAAGPSLVASATMGAISQRVDGGTAAQRHNDTQEYANAQARDAAAMPPPPRPVRIRIDHSLRPHIFRSHPAHFNSTNRPSESNCTQADYEEKKELRGTKDHVPESEYRFATDEEIATMSARSDAAMAEIYRMCEPFLDPCANIQAPPPMEVSTELIDDLGVGFLFPTYASSPTRARGNNEVKRNPMRTMQARNVAHMAPSKQGTKRKEYPEDRQNFKHVQFEAERQERRPIKKVKSAHNANPQRSDAQLNKDAAKNSQQQQPFDSQLREYLSGYEYGRTSGGPAPQGSQAPRHVMVEDVDTYNGGVLHGEQIGGIMGRYSNQVSEPYQPQHYPSTLSRTTFPDHQPPREPVASPHIPAPTRRRGFLDNPSSVLDPGVSVHAFPYGDVQSGRAKEPQTYNTSSAPNAQDVQQRQQAMARPSPKADHVHHREPRAHNSHNVRYHPYAKSRRGIPQSIEAPQVQQLGGGSSVQPVGTAAAQVDKPSIPDIAPASLEQDSPPNPVLDFQWDPEWDRFLEEL